MENSRNSTISALSPVLGSGLSFPFLLMIRMPARVPAPFAKAWRQPKLKGLAIRAAKPDLGRSSHSSRPKPRSPIPSALNKVVVNCSSLWYIISVPTSWRLFPSGLQIRIRGGGGAMP